MFQSWRSRTVVGPPSADTFADMQRVIDAFHARLGGNLDRAIRTLRAAGIGFYASLPEAAARAAVQRAFEAFGQDFGVDPATHFFALMHAIGEQRSGMGVSIGEILWGMNHGFEAVSQDFAELFADDPEARIYWEQERSRISYAGAAGLADAYTLARERVVRAQADEILKLSTRVFRVHRGVLLLPLVGSLAADRMQQITAAALDAVAADRARVVLIDVSAVPGVDAEAGAALLRTAQAVRLLGATPLLIGVHPEVARTMVTGGVDLGALTTLADLESGLEHARKLLG